MTITLLSIVLIAEDPIDFNRQIRPILADRCFACHGPDQGTRQADLRLDDRALALSKKAIVPGKPEQSGVVARIFSSEPEERMPPPNSHLSLTADEKRLIKEWIAHGAEYRPHWAFVPPSHSFPRPKVTTSAWPIQELDYFVLARLERERRKPSPPAEKPIWLRRVSLALTGLPPTVTEIDDFLADRTAQAHERVVDRLLASSRFGERLAIDWLDAARYADSFGYQADADMNVWPWRDWVVRAFNANVPFDRFLTMQLAGDLLENPTLDDRLATTFNRLHRMTNEGGSIAEEWRIESVCDRVQTLGTAIMGLTLECARCHDHKFDPISTTEFYRLSAFFNNIDEWGTYNHQDFKPSPTLKMPTPEQSQELERLQRAVHDAEHRLKQLQATHANAFEKWLENPKWGLEHGLVGYYSLDRPKSGFQLANTANSKLHGTSSSQNRFVPGFKGDALECTGDDAIELPGVLGVIERWQPFTICFFLKRPESLKNGIVFHRQAGTDSGFNGTECSLVDGRLQLAIARFWPGNAIAVATKHPLPPNKWVHIAVRYQGTSRASGISLFVDGAPAETEVVRDNLQDNVDAHHGHGAGKTGITFGERFRSLGLKLGCLDEIRVYDRPLTNIEVSQLFDGHSLADAIHRKDRTRLTEYFRSVVHPETAKLQAELIHQRKTLFAAQSRVPSIMTMEEMKVPRPAYVLDRGSYESPKGAPVSRGTPAALLPFPEGFPKNRLGLAQWLTHPDHPLTARVAVNRIWAAFFGRGLVSTQENFGTQGSLPTHQLLLDFLARRFINSGWNVKQLCKEIALSATFRQQSSCDLSWSDRDPENQLLARGPIRRLSAEEIRDASFFVGGILVERLGGPPVKPLQPPGLWHGQNAFLPEYVPDQGEALRRRSLYTFLRRTSPPPNMLAFDATARETCVARRSPTTTPMQPLVLLNDPQFVSAARGLGRRMLASGTKSEEQIRWAFRTTATRNPTDDEMKILLRWFQAKRDHFKNHPKETEALLGQGMDPPPRDQRTPDLAAASELGSVLLNLDAFINVR